MIMIFNCIDWYFKRIARVSIYMKKNLNIMHFVIDPFFFTVWPNLFQSHESLIFSKGMQSVSQKPSLHHRENI